MDITKVVIPAAGLGSRFLPLSKAVPKELLPLLNKPQFSTSWKKVCFRKCTTLFLSREKTVKSCLII